MRGEDAAVYIISLNVARRHMTKAQTAIVVAKAYPEAAEHGRGF